MDKDFQFCRVLLILWKSSEDVEEFADNFMKEGLRVSLYIREEEDVSLEEVLEREQKKCSCEKERLREETLLITDDPWTARAGAERKIAVLGYRPSEEKEDYFEGAQYVAEELAGVEADYLNLVYARAHGIPLVIGVTERTLIREMGVEDLPALYGLYGEPGVREWVEPLYEYEEEAEFTRAYIKNMYGLYGYGLWLVFDRRTGELIGRAGISNRMIDGEECQELGYIIREKRMHQGFGYEVSGAILQYAAEKLGLTRMYLVAERENLASIGLAEKLGFKVLGEARADQKETAPPQRDCLIFYKEL